MVQANVCGDSTFKRTEKRLSKPCRQVGARSAVIESPALRVGNDDKGKTIDRTRKRRAKERINAFASA